MFLVVYLKFLNTVFTMKIKGTVSVILHAKLAMSDSQQYTLKLCLTKFELNFFVSFCGFSAKVTCAFLAYKNNGDWGVKKNVVIFHTFDQMKVSKVSCCESGIVIFAFRAHL